LLYAIFYLKEKRRKEEDVNKSFVLCVARFDGCAKPLLGHLSSSNMKEDLGWSDGFVN
jgi:hypothetical protein